jgi:threonyl-tRNA synthetase
MADIRVQLSGGEPATIAAGTTIREVCKTLLSNKQRKQTVAMRIGDNLIDFSTPLQADAVLTPVPIGSEEALDLLRHSTAHIMALPSGKYSAAG